MEAACNFGGTSSGGRWRQKPVCRAQGEEQVIGSVDISSMKFYHKRKKEVGVASRTCMRKESGKDACGAGKSLGLAVG